MRLCIYGCLLSMTWELLMRLLELRLLRKEWLPSLASECELLLVMILGRLHFRLKELLRRDGDLELHPKCDLPFLLLFGLNFFALFRGLAY